MPSLVKYRPLDSLRIKIASAVKTTENMESTTLDLGIIVDFLCGNVVVCCLIHLLTGQASRDGEEKKVQTHHPINNYSCDDSDSDDVRRTQFDSSP